MSVVGRLGGSTPVAFRCPFGHLRADVFPKIAELGHDAACGYCRPRARAAASRCRPRLRPSTRNRSWSMGTASPRRSLNRGGRRVADKSADASDAELTPHDFEPRKSERTLFIAVRLLLVLALQIQLLARLFSIAVVHLIAEHHDVFKPMRSASRWSIWPSFKRVQFLAETLEQGAPAAGKLQPLCQLKGVVK